MSVVSRVASRSRRPSVLKTALAGLLAFGFSGQAIASCYTPREAAAEQAIRAHSELMVVGLTCASYFDEPLLFNRYATFTNQHQGDIQRHEQVMIDYFAKTAEGNPKRRFDHWRTSIANGVSTRAALSSGSVYCGKKQEMLQTMEGSANFGASSLPVILASAPEAAVVSRPMCVQDAIAQSEVE